MPDEQERTFEWLWWVAAAAAVGCIVLIVAYYARHPERSVLVDFQPRQPADVVPINGSTPPAADDSAPEGATTGPDLSPN